MFFFLLNKRLRQTTFSCFGKQIRLNISLVSDNLHKGKHFFCLKNTEENLLLLQSNSCQFNGYVVFIINSLNPLILLVFHVGYDA